MLALECKLDMENRVMAHRYKQLYGKSLARMASSGVRSRMMFSFGQPSFTEWNTLRGVSSENAMLWNS